MRDAQRLDNFYAELCNLHKEKIPDWRFGQFMFNFINWCFDVKKIDVFFPEEDRMLKLLDEFFSTYSR